MATEATVVEPGMLSRRIEWIVHRRFEIEAHGGVSRCAVKHSVMLEQRRNHEHVVELHVERPMGDTLLGRQQHPDDQLVIAGDALRTHADAETADAEREIADADMGQAAAQSPASELHDVDVRAVNGPVKALETIKLLRIDQKKMSHDRTLLLKRDNSAAGSNKTPPQREVGAINGLRVLRQIITEFAAIDSPLNALA